MENNYLPDTGNRHCFVYTTDHLKMEILGGVRIDLLDRMCTIDEGKYFKLSDDPDK